MSNMKPDLYNDPSKKLEYAVYMSKLAPNDTSPEKKAYWEQKAEKLQKSRSGHDKATKLTEAKIKAAQAAARKK